MSLRNRLLALSLLTLLLPWSGWKLLQELESFLREAQEEALLSTTRAIAGTLPFEFQSQLIFAPERYAVLRSLNRPAVLDGSLDDWPSAEHTLELVSADDSMTVHFMAATASNGLLLLFDVAHEPGSGSAMRQGTDFTGAGIELLLRSPRGLLRFNLEPEAPGPLQLSSDNDGGQAEGFWMDTARGYRVELALPAFARHADLAFTVRSSNSEVNSSYAGRTAPGNASSTPAWITLVPEWQEMSALLAQAVPEGSRAWLINQDGWVLAHSGTGSELPAQQTTWIQRTFYRLVAGSRTALEADDGEPKVRLRSPLMEQALKGEQGASWTQDPDTAVVRTTVAVPVELQGVTRGAMVLQSSSDGLLLVTNRALGRLLLTTLVITFGLAGGLWFFATRLSQRVRRLSGAVSEAMSDGVVAERLPLTSDRDELGALARNNEKLLRAVSDYNQYLQTLAGKLSHELKTPLAITRSSLDNLSSQPISEDAQRFLARAQEGVERQAAIVRAMSEANRLEASIRVAEWTSVDLAELVSRCAEAYRSAYPGRSIQIQLAASPLPLRCAPELLAQALDKLVDNAMSLSGSDDRVLISLQRAENEVQLCVRNTGSQLPAEFQDRLFDSLVSFREKRDNSPHLGLGLYIVRLVAAAHGGSVDAENLPDGEGVEFTI
ncbi:MAG TPA: ATP-binding protein, partial [Xanthomonadales bacterium]|nr:ATP-binding protein [Xanthomonadales bacterium]